MYTFAKKSKKQKVKMKNKMKKVYFYCCCYSFTFESVLALFYVCASVHEINGDWRVAESGW